jgi:hypothetical protein
MDSSQPAIRELLEFSCVRRLRTVGDALEAGGAGALLDDPLVRIWGFQGLGLQGFWVSKDSGLSV